MLLLGLLSLIIGGGALGMNPDSAGGMTPVRDTVRAVAQRDSALARSVDHRGRHARHRRPRPRAVEVSEWYSRRLTIHRYVAYATIPVFALAVRRGRSALQEEPRRADVGEDDAPGGRDGARRHVHGEHGHRRVELVGLAVDYAGASAANSSRARRCWPPTPRSRMRAPSCANEAETSSTSDGCIEPSRCRRWA